MMTSASIRLVDGAKPAMLAAAAHSLFQVRREVWSAISLSPR